MTNKLSHDEFVPCAPEQPGSVHVHHCKQGPGKNKMYVTRLDNGNIIAFCHHCNSSGFYGIRNNANAANSTDASSHIRVSSFQGKGGYGSAPFSIPSDSEGKALVWPKEPLDWARQYLTLDQLSDSPLTYSACEQALIFPMINADYPHTLVGFQLRKFPESEPKYLTNRNNSLALDTPIDPFYTALSKTLVITEDWISAYKAALAGYEGLPLMGANLRESQFVHLLKFKYERYVIALDNDNPLIRRQQRTLDTRLSGYAPTLLLKLTKDLKEYSLDDIKDLIE